MCFKTGLMTSKPPKFDFWKTEVGDFTVYSYWFHDKKLTYTSTKPLTEEEFMQFLGY